jgi:hypothetical protein
MTLTSVIPAKGTTGIGPIEITATGSGFIPGTTLYLYGDSLETTLVSSTELRAVVPALGNPFTPDLRVGIPRGHFFNRQFHGHELGHGNETAAEVHSRRRLSVRTIDVTDS